MQEQQKIGYLIKQTRINKNLTQGDFAKLLKTSQSAVARMESGNQNFTTKELLKISKILNHKILEISESVDLKIRGGKKLRGSVNTNTSKNGALSLMNLALLNNGKTVIRNVPKIEEINRLIEVFKEIGVNVNWINDRDLEIVKSGKIKKSGLMSESAKKIRSGLMMIGPLSHFINSFRMPNAGGCKMGVRTISAHQFALENLGVSIETHEKFYEIETAELREKLKSIKIENQKFAIQKKSKKLSKDQLQKLLKEQLQKNDGKNPKNQSEIIMYEMSDTATINALLAAALVPAQTDIKFASANYHVQDVCFALEKAGVEIEGIGTTNLKIFGLPEIDQNLELFVSEDPTEAMMFISAAIVTNSKLEIKRVPIDFLSLELLKLEKMGLKYKKSKVYKSVNEKTDLVDVIIFPSKLKALPDKIHAQPYPGINTDNLPFFVPIATGAEGITLIHDWMWENRAIYFTELNKLGARVDLADPHRVLIAGKTDLKGSQIVCPPALRPATIILVAMLGAKGESILRNVYSIRRGYEQIADRLNKLGADIEVIREM